MAAALALDRGVLLRARGDAPADGRPQPPDDLARRPEVARAARRQRDVARSARWCCSPATCSRRARSTAAGSSVIQPLLVTTIVFALPLGYFLTKQHVGPARGDRRDRDHHRARAVRLLRRPGRRQRECVQQPVGDRDRRCSPCSAPLLFVFGRGGGLSMKAAVYGTVAGVMFGLSSALTKPTLDYLHESVGTMLSHWECYALAIAGVGRLHPAAGVARHRAPGALRGDRVGGEPGRRDPDRDPPPRRASQPADLARRRRRDRPRARARRRGRDLARPRGGEGRAYPLRTRRTAPSRPPSGATR